MNTFRKMLHALTERAGSERKAAVLLDISPTSFNAWCRARAFPTDEQARRLAALLQLDDAYVLAIVHGARSKSDDTRATWDRIAAAFSKAAGLAIMAAAPFVMPPPANAAGFDIASTQYTLRNRRYQPTGTRAR